MTDPTIDACVDAILAWADNPDATVTKLRSILAAHFGGTTVWAIADRNWSVLTVAMGCSFYANPRQLCHSVPPECVRRFVVREVPSE